MIAELNANLRGMIDPRTREEVEVGERCVVEVPGQFSHEIQRSEEYRVTIARYTSGLCIICHNSACALESIINIDRGDLLRLSHDAVHTKWVSCNGSIDEGRMITECTCEIGTCVVIWHSHQLVGAERRTIASHDPA
jgi:hypothetical protein